MIKSFTNPVIDACFAIARGFPREAMKSGDHFMFFRNDGLDPALLGEKTGPGLAYGVFGHFSNGVLLAILYAGIAPSLWGPSWIRPYIFITAQTVALVWFFMFPLVGAGVA